MAKVQKSDPPTIVGRDAVPFAQWRVAQPVVPVPPARAVHRVVQRSQDRPVGCRRIGGALGRVCASTELQTERAKVACRYVPQPIGNAPGKSVASPQPQPFQIVKTTESRRYVAGKLVSVEMEPQQVAERAQLGWYRPRSTGSHRAGAIPCW